MDSLALQVGILSGLKKPLTCSGSVPGLTSSQILSLLLLWPVLARCGMLPLLITGHRAVTILSTLLPILALGFWEERRCLTCS